MHGEGIFARQLHYLFHFRFTSEVNSNLQTLLTKFETLVLS